MTRLFDTHCHVQDAAFDGDRQQVLASAQATLAGLVVVGDNLASSRDAVGLIRRGVFAAVGIHPHCANECDEASLAYLGDLAATPGVVALGEIGLDYYRHKTNRQAQIQTFRRQLALAGNLGLPVIVHDREAHEDIAAALEEFHGGLVGGVMHCFSGDAAFARRCIAWGFQISFAGNVTYPKANALREAAGAVPLENLLVETDAPYLAPQPVRGKRCEPCHVQHTAEALAEIKGMTFEELASQTTQNAWRLFTAAKGEKHRCP